MTTTLDKIYVTVDIIIRYKGGIILIERKEQPLGLALPGGHVELDESCEQAAVREAKEETNLSVILLKQLKTYSDPQRDPRKRCISVVFIGEGFGQLKAGDDAKEAHVFSLDKIPRDKLCFDHKQILIDYMNDIEEDE
ncbi:NUDIX hydrolase [Candidatus Woesearchaeota archaeon]|nr:NUDIX hydrolase [Candidatus Woesearchaeota archaeon]